MRTRGGGRDAEPPSCAPVLCLRAGEGQVGVGVVSQHRIRFTSTLLMPPRYRDPRRVLLPEGPSWVTPEALPKCCLSWGSGLTNLWKKCTYVEGSKKSRLFA